MSRILAIDPESSSTPSRKTADLYDLDSFSKAAPFDELASQKEAIEIVKRTASSTEKLNRSKEVIVPAANATPLAQPASQNEAIEMIRRASSIEKMDQSRTVALQDLKPVLDPPSLNWSYWKIINFTLRLEQLGSEMIDLNDKRTEYHFQEIQTLDREEMLKMKEAADRAQTSSFWKFLQDIGSLFSAAFSIVLGLPLLFTGAGTLVGGAMVAAGILSITNFIFKQTDVWNWLAKSIAGDNENLARNLENILPAVVGVVCGVVGLAGSVGAFFFSSLDFGQKIFTIGQTALNFAEGIVSIGSGYSQARMKWTEGDLTEIQTKSQVHKLHMEYLMVQMQDIFREQTKVDEEAGNIFDAINQSNMIISQQIV